MTRDTDESPDLAGSTEKEHILIVGDPAIEQTTLLRRGELDG